MKNQSMAKIRRSITRLIKLENSHCGFDELVNKAVDARFRLEELIELELDEAEQRGRRQGMDYKNPFERKINSDLDDEANRMEQKAGTKS